MRYSFATALAIAVFIRTATSWAADHGNLEKGFPTQVEDAYATEHLNREAQLALGYSRTREKENKLLAYPRLEFSFARNWQLRVGVPFEFDTRSIDRTDGLFGTELFYNFNTEDVAVPAFALSGQVRVPLNLESEGVDSELELLATKTIIYPVRGQLHLNVAWQHLYDTPVPGEYRNGYVAVLGYSQRLTTSTILVLDFVRERAIRKEKKQNRAELGVRLQATPFTVLSLGAAVGIRQNSDKFRAIGAVQHSF